jgi:hypothetical protein
MRLTASGVVVLAVRLITVPEVIAARLFVVVLVTVGVPTYSDGNAPMSSMPLTMIGSPMFHVIELASVSVLPA